VEYKDDSSPITLADKNANEVIVSYLEETNIPILSEEGAEFEYSQRKNWAELWIVDPLDGTKEFVKRNGEFTVNIALIRKKIPVFGVIYVPVSRVLYFGGSEFGSFKIDDTAEIYNDLEQLMQPNTRLPLRTERPYTVVASRSHLSDETQEFISSKKEKHPDLIITSMGSSLKICLVAEGKADVYPRFAPTMEWDIAAGHAIIQGTGNEIIDFQTKAPMLYNRENLLNNWFVVE
jgi:3'(2'), 5'-bisphosphate nucleotidase